MTTLTAQDIAEVAREVSGNPFEIDGNQVFRKLPSGYYEIWNPYFDTVRTEQRSQALAVVEWLADKIYFTEESDSDAGNFLFYVATKDIDALQRMVLELKRGR